MSKSQKELRLFMPIGDDEIQVDSYDKKLNEQVLKLKEEEPDAVYIIYDDEAPAFLSAAVMMTNISISFHKTKEPAELTEAQKKARSENGKRAVENNNLLNLK